MRRFQWSIIVATLGFLACDSPGDPEPLTGSLQLSVGGLPDTINAAIQLTGPGGFSAQITRGQTFTGLVPGTYTVAAAPVVTGIATFVPAFQSQTVTVGASAMSQATIIYTVTTGSISVLVSGLPPDVPGQVLITGPDGYRDSTSANRTLGNLKPGIYFVSARERQKGLNVYAPSRPEFSVTVSASVTPATAAVDYALITGTLALHLNGLPAGVSGNVTITGPLGFVATFNSSATLEGLRQGRYVIAAAPVGSGSGQRNPTPATQNLVVVAGSTAVVSVNYWPLTAPPGLNLGIDAVHLQQVVQTYGGAVPAIAGRDALLRVFGRASEPNVVAPSVRVRLYDGLQLLGSYSVPALRTGVPTTIDEGDLSASWNLPVPAAMIRPGLRILADVDPDNVIAEADESDNTWPSSGSPLAMDVRTAPPLTVRLVPVAQSVNGLTGNITPANIGQYAAAARQLLPISTLVTEIRPTYTTNAPPLQPNDANGAWPQVLSELNALRAAEGSSAHYYGLVKVPYTAGVVGVSYLPSFVAVGFDSLPNAAATFVHELGHHFGRLHSPSCGAGGYDANYPYAGGVIGVYGYDLSTGTLRPPSTPDLMGYCDGRWISDYTYSGILGFRASQTATQALVAAETLPRQGMLIWGRISGARAILEPAFEVTAPRRLPSGGRHRLELFDGSGNKLTSFTFDGDRVVDGRSDNEQFAFVIPLELFSGKSPSRIRLVSAGSTVERTASLAQSVDQMVASFSAVVERASPSRVRVTWQDAPGRGVLVRDALTGAILTLARGGRADVITTEQRVDLTLSDGVRSARRSVLVR